MALFTTNNSSYTSRNYETIIDLYNKGLEKKTGENKDTDFTVDEDSRIDSNDKDSDDMNFQKEKHRNQEPDKEIQYNNDSLNESDDNNKLTDVPSLDVKIEGKQLFKDILAAKRQYK
ncbi:hypothetical protein RI543_003666 [Arxiozyma heterogenica]|uniref:Uncharacterized protein n=1 Tax=Arxiozyma heterogenica TaxID=278026 RepID=A0AAN7WLF7_9SACH|nr:hypothetical protein RI543_003666 [Kazachstania heterogenica]